MKVLMTTDTVGGVWTYSLQLAQALAKHDVQVALATMGAPLTHTQREEAIQISTLQLFESHFKLEWMEDPWADVDAAGEWLLSLQDKIGPDVVHLNSYTHGALPWQAPVMVVGHSCVLSWWETVKGEAAPPVWDCYRNRVRCGLQAADMVIAPSRAMLGALVRHYGPLPHSEVIYNGRDASLFTPGKKAEFVLTAGRLWDDAKNVAMLEQVAPELAWPVYVAGEDEHPEGGRTNLSGLRLLGKLSAEEMASKMALASIYALPARYEPFGLSVLEAGLAGCVLVLGDIPSLREIWGDAAIFVLPDDRQAVEATLQSLIFDAEHRKAMAQRAHKRAQEYSIERMIDAYIGSYRNLLRTQLQENVLCAS